MPKKRPKQNRSVLKKMHIYCEGRKTEPTYIKKYLEQLDNAQLRDVIIIEDTRKNTPIQLVKAAIEHKNSRACPPDDIFWVVYDRESVATYSDHLHDQAYTQARDNRIEIAISNVCFEQWLLLHFGGYAAPYSCYDDLINRSCLRQEFKRISGGKEYDKGCEDIFRYVSSEIGKARSRAKAINKRTLDAAPAGKTKPYQLAPYTDMPKLLDAIDSFVP
ncbi:RloB family protein [Pseudomonas corrugata]|uniref:RloB family protein n=1 Tax=Pseudomonas corrugata TaxID=47879 RepID=UPI003ED9E970